MIYISSMALSIKSDETDRLVRELAAETGDLCCYDTAAVVRSFGHVDPGQSCGS